MEETFIYPSTNSPFDSMEVIRNLDKCLEAVQRNHPIFIIIDGGQSSGKTTLAIHIIDYINKKIGKSPIDLTDKNNCQYSLGGQQFLKKLPESSKLGYKIACYDEGGDYVRKGAISRFNKAMDRAMDVIRIHNNIILFLCHDWVHQVPSEFMNKRIVTMLIHNKKRKLDTNYVTSYVYDYEGMCWLLYWSRKLVIPEQIYTCVSPSFMFRFKNLPPDREAQLIHLGKSKKIDLWESAEIKAEGLKSFTDISEATGMSKAWVQKKITELNIKEQIIVKKKKYYNPEVVERLRRS